MEYGYIPLTNLAGRPLYSYLIKKSTKKRIGYGILEGKRTFVQTVLSANE
ncbi:MAG: hypothetical protein ACTSRI_06535 [Promethearchaeota archaeon]